MVQTVPVGRVHTQNLTIVRIHCNNSHCLRWSGTVWTITHLCLIGFDRITDNLLNIRIDCWNHILTIHRIYNRLEGEETKDSQYQILKKQLSITDKKKFEEYLDVESKENEGLSKEERTKRQRVKGVWFEEDYLRIYPMNSLACDLIGFTYTGNTADWGIEGYYSSVLNGVNGRQFGYFNSDADV